MSLLLLLDATKRFFGLQTKAHITNTSLTATITHTQLRAAITNYRTTTTISPHKTGVTFLG